MMQKKMAVLYHYPCHDGVFAALAAHLYFSANSIPSLFFPNTVYSPITISQLPLEEISHLYLLDFTGPPGFVQQLSPQVDNVVILDHHKTAIETLGDDDVSSTCKNVTSVLDIKRSGATIAFDYFTQKLTDECKEMNDFKRMRRVFEYIEDADIWKWELPESKAFNSGILDLKIEYDFNLNQSLFQQLLSLDHETVINRGKQSLSKKRKLIHEALEQSYEIVLGGSCDEEFGRCLAVNADDEVAELRSELGNQLAEKSKNLKFRGIGAVVYRVAELGDEKKLKVSLRSVAEEDTTPVSQRFGGGGHKNASSFLLSSVEFEHWKDSWEQHQVESSTTLHKSECMAEAVVSFGVEKLWELLTRESARLNGIDEQVDGLKRQLGRLQSLLKDAHDKRNESERVRNFLEDVKDIVFDADDIIESFLLKELRGKDKGIKKHARRLACVLVDRRNFASDIEGITKRISEVIAGMKSLGIRHIIDSGGCSSSLSLQERQREIRQTFSNKSESDLVGLDQSVEELVDHLVEDDSIQVISVSGMGGIGKTTLARQVFHHDIVRRHFDGFSWVCVSQQFTRKDVWQRMLQDLRPYDEDVIQMDEYTLQGKLFELLETGRYLLVLDDVWKEEDWDRIKAVFPHKRGWKLLLTSRNEGVGLHVDPTCFAFRPRILTPEESWKLFERIVSPRRNETGFRVDEAMGKEMITYCGGLPLAVKVLGGLLAKKHTVLEWKRVYSNIVTQIVGKSGLNDDNPNSVYRVLSLSYEDLPMQLKHCFLYLAHFPEDYKIEVKTLFNYWVAEGIIVSIYDGSTIQDSGESYLDELVRRNMVVVEESYLSSRIEYCQMHDMMREVCLSKAKEENFLQVVKVPIATVTTINAQSPCRSRRLVLHSGDALHMLGHKGNKKARSVLVFGADENLWKLSGLRCLPLLRVLDLSYVQFEGGKLPSSIGELIHLRFLSLYEAGVSHLPSSLRNLKLLLCLNLGVVDRLLVHVPNVLKEMQELRYLRLPRSMPAKTKLELSDLVNLESLTNFSTKHSSVTDLLRMTKLTVLNVVFSGGCTFETLLSSLGELRNLETLSFYDFQKISVAEHGGGELVLDFSHLKDLTLSMHMPRFPDQYRFPPLLAHIWLIGCRMEEDPMPILEKLLHLKSVYLSSGAFVGKVMVCSKSGFPQLLALKMSYKKELVEWRVEEGSMPCLRTLTIENCKKLKQLPDGLKFISCLKELKIERMKREWTEKLVIGGEDYYKVQHIPSVQFINCGH